MSGCNYREKEGGARLGEVRHDSIEKLVKSGSGRTAIGLRSACTRTTGLSSTVPAAHIQEHSTVPWVAA
jgi:hypothetical protein